MELPEGLLELDAPLSDEEKQRQKTEADEARAAGERTKREVGLISPRRTQSAQRKQIWGILLDFSSVRLCGLRGEPSS